MDFNINFNELYYLIFFFIKEHQLYFFIVLAAIIGKIKESSKQNTFSVWVTYFFGTLFHELSHYIAALLTNGKPKMASLFPRKITDGEGNYRYILGYVSIANSKWYNVFFISMSPFLLLILSFYVYLYYFTYIEESLLSYLGYIFIIISLVFSSLPSKEDFSVLFSSTKSVKVNKYGEMKKRTTFSILNFAIPIILIALYFLYIKGEI